MVELIIVVIILVVLIGAFATSFFIVRKKHSTLIETLDVKDSQVAQFEVQASQKDAAELVKPLEHDITLEQKLEKTRGFFRQKLAPILKIDTFSKEAFDEIEEALISSDVGLELAEEITQKLSKKARELEVTKSSELINLLADLLTDELNVGNKNLEINPSLKPNTWLVVGVNGSGKTTTIGKLAYLMSKGGYKVLLAAGDTFRAAALDQLEIWAQKANVEIVKGSQGADPASVIYDAISKARAKGYDLVIADTAGRLHTKVNLMEELKKVKRVANKDQETVSEVLLVLDGTTGQNGLAQAKVFLDALNVTGIIVTKLDGTAKGGVIISIAKTLKLPVKMIGVGETQEDLIEFDAKEFVKAILR